LFGYPGILLLVRQVAVEAADVPLYSRHSMKPDLARHLDRTRDTVAEVDRVVSSHSYHSDRRTVMVIGLLSTIIEHHRGMLQLIKSGMVGSACALARDLVKGTRYGLWINSCATDEQIHRIEEGEEFPFSIPDVVREIEAAFSADPFFENLKSRWGARLYRFSRSGIFQLGRWTIDSSSGLVSDEHEIRDMTAIATLCIVLLAAKFLATKKHEPDCVRIEALAAGYAAPRV